MQQLVYRVHLKYCSRFSFPMPICVLTHPHSCQLYSKRLSSCFWYCYLSCVKQPHYTSVSETKISKYFQLWGSNICICGISWNLVATTMTLFEDGLSFSVHSLLLISTILTLTYPYCKYEYFMNVLLFSQTLDDRHTPIIYIPLRKVFVQSSSAEFWQIQEQFHCRRTNSYFS